MRTRGYNSCISWMTALACSVVGFLLTVPIRISGLLYIIIIDRYQTSRMYATIPLVVLSTIRCLIGPLVGYLGEVCGLRSVTLLGCLLASLGVGACFFAEDIITVVIFLGFVYGIGFGLGTSLIPEILKLHFDRDINLVNGMFLTGCCLSGLVMPPAVQRLTEEYGDSGMFLLLAGIILQSMPFAMMLKDPKNEEYHAGIENQMKCRAQMIDKLDQIRTEEKVAFIRETSVKGTSATANKIGENYKYGNGNNESMHSDVKPLVKFYKLMRNVKIIKKTVSNNEDLNSDSKNFDINMYTSRSCNDLNYNCTECSQSEELNMLNQKNAISDSNYDYGDSVDKIITNHDVENHQSMASLEVTEMTSTTADGKRHKLVRLFLDPTFLVTMTVQSFHTFFMTMNWTIMIDYARDKGISVSDSLYILMFLPLAEITGNMCLNWISDRGFLTRTKYCVICSLFLGSVSISLVWVNDFQSMLAAILLYGVLTATVGAVFPGMIHEFIEEDLQGLALCSRYVLYAFLGFAKSPLTGYFRGTLGSYDWIYFIIAISCLLNVFLMMLTPVLASRRENKGLKKVAAVKS